MVNQLLKDQENIKISEKLMKTNQQEYIGLLKKFEIEYNDKYLFDWID